MLARRHGPEANRAHDAGIAERRLGRDDAVGDEVVEGGVLLLLDVEHGAVFEGPLHDVGVGRTAFYPFALGERGPEGGEGLELDEVPDGAGVGGYDGGFADGGGGGDGGHFGNWSVGVDGVFCGGSGLEEEMVELGVVGGIEVGVR